MMKFLFDLDGTITMQETLPLIAKHFKVDAEIEELTRETMYGDIPFMESFIRRCHILGKLPVDEIDDLLSDVPLYPKVVQFIIENKERCAITTGNLGCWIEQLGKKIGCVCYNSTGEVENNSVVKLIKILRKEDIVEQYQCNGDKVVFVGDGNNDMEAMRKADISIACGLTHYPAASVLTITDYLIFDEDALCRQLNQLL